MAVRRPELIEGFIANVVVRVRRTAATAAVHDDVRAVVGLDPRPMAWRCSATRWPPT